MAVLQTGSRWQVSTIAGLEAGAQIFSYSAGTLVPLSTFTNQGGGSANANPTICDANGEADIWLTAGVGYRFIVKRSVANGGATISDVDNITAPVTSGSTATFANLTVTSNTTSATATIGALTTTGNTILGDATTDTLNVGAGGIVKDASGNVQMSGTLAVTGNLSAPNFYFSSGLAAAAGTYGFSTVNGPSIEMYGTASAGTGDMYFKTAGSAGVTKIRITNAGNLIPFADNSYANGGSSNRWSTVFGVLANFSGIVTASAGINFGGSTLSTYTDTTAFTPVLTGIGAPVYTTQTGEYSRIGNRIKFRVSLSWTGGTNATAITGITGLPTASTAAIHIVQLLVNFSNLTLTYTGTPIAYLAGTATINLGIQASGATIASLINVNAGTKDIYLAGEYFV